METTITIPINTMSIGIRDFIKELTEVFQIHQDYVTTAIMAAVGTAVGRRLILTDPKGYENTPALWWCHVAPSGYGKSAAAAAIMRPLSSIQMQWRRDYQKDLKNWEKTEKLESNRPKEHKMFVSDATPEALYGAMETNNGEILLYRDELAGWIKDFGRYNASGEVENHLSAWSQEHVSFGRVNKGYIDIEHPHFSVFGGTQPKRLKPIFGAEALVDNGFDARFCWVWPQTQLTAKYNRRKLSSMAADGWHGYIRQLIALTPRTIQMSDDAAELYIKWWEDIQQQRINQVDGWMRESLAKIQIIAERVATIYWLLTEKNIQENFENSYELDVDSMQAAIGAMECLKHWSAKVMNEIFPAGEPANQISNIQMIRFLKNKGLKQAEIADKLGLSQGHVSKVLSKM